MRVNQSIALLECCQLFGVLFRDRRPSHVDQVFFDFPFTVPPYFALITRALIVLEGIAVTGDPNFDLFQASYPYADPHALTLVPSRA